MRKSRILFGSIALAFLLSACGGSSSDAAMGKSYEPEAEEYYYDSYDTTEESKMAADESYEEANVDLGSGISGEKGVITDDPEGNSDVEANAKNRKLIKTVDMSVETESFDALLETVLAKVDALGGYTESSNVNGRSGSSHSNRNASITARIPEDRLSEFTDTVTGNSNVLYKNESTEDVTLNYVDTKSKLESLKTEQTRLNELLAKADNLESIIALEERLSEVRYEIGSYESRLRVMDNQVAYSTVYVNIEEVTKYTPTESLKKSLGQRMAEEFKESMERVSEALQDFLVGLVAALPALLLLALVVAVIVVIIRAIVKAGRKRKAKKGVKDNRKNFDPMTGEPLKKEKEEKDRDPGEESK